MGIWNKVTWNAKYIIYTRLPLKRRNNISAIFFYRNVNKKHTPESDMSPEFNVQVSLQLSQELRKSLVRVSFSFSKSIASQLMRVPSQPCAVMTVNYFNRIATKINPRPIEIMNRKKLRIFQKYNQLKINDDNFYCKVFFLSLYALSSLQSLPFFRLMCRARFLA